MNKAQGNESNASSEIGAQAGSDKPNEMTESPEERVSRLYNAEEGPLIGWLMDEAHRRHMDLQEMARAVGVTYGYINQLRTGIRKTSQISHDFASACAEFLGVPTAVVLILSGYLTMSDFAVRAESEEVRVERALRFVQDDPVVKASIPIDLSKLCLDGKRAVALMYTEATGHDVFQTYQIPEILRSLQKAVLAHDENSFFAAAGHRDTSVRLES